RGCNVFTRPSSTSGKSVKLEISRTGTPSLRNSSAVPPVEIISTPCFSSARAKEAIPFLFETEMRARVIFKEARCWPKDFPASSDLGRVGALRWPDAAARRPCLFLFVPLQDHAVHHAADFQEFFLVMHHVGASE